MGQALVPTERVPGLERELEFVLQAWSPMAWELVLLAFPKLEPLLALVSEQVLVAEPVLVLVLDLALVSD
jgi:hypothetical protein